LEENSDDYFVDVGTPTSALPPTTKPLCPAVTAALRLVAHLKVVVSVKNFSFNSKPAEKGAQ